MFFDPRMNLSAAWYCGLIGTPYLPAFASTFASVQLTYMEDDHHLLSFNRSDECVGARKALFPQKHKPNKAWSWALNAMPRSNLTNCDVESYGANAACASQVVISYSSQVATYTRSKPGISRIAIWLNAGGVIGGVQFFFWFLAMFSAY